jgi:uncharacterized protein
MKKNMNRSVNIIILVVFLVISFGRKIVTLIVDYMWFDSLGYKQLFLTPISAKVSLFIQFFILTFIIFFINDKIAFHFKKEKENEKTLLNKFHLFVGLAISFFIGIYASLNWNIYLKYLNGTSFNLLDPIFSKDIAYYVFKLPYLSFIVYILGMILVANTIWVSIIYLWKEINELFVTYNVPNTNNFDNDVTKDVSSVMPTKKVKFNISTSSKNHLFILASLFFILSAFSHFLMRYNILFSKTGVVFGAGFSDVNVSLPIANILAVVSIVIAISFLIRIFIKSKKVKRRHVIISLIGIYLVFLLSSMLIPNLVQSFKVDPNEYSLEEQYIKHNINFTNIAYDLTGVNEIFYEVSDVADNNILKRNQEGIKELRILDWRPLTQTYKQLQEIRLYYDFYDVDIDRYEIDGKTTQVMVSARELNHVQLRDKAKTWINEHLIFTHGYGLVMSPVNKITSEGLPEFLIKDIPPVSDDFDIVRPEIYYGEIDNSFIIVNTNIDEFDYSKGDNNEYTKYSGKGGIQIDSFTKKVLLAIYFSDINIILNSDITKESRILFTRTIQDRISKVVPFLSMDEDPYVVTVDGRIKWIQDAYTLTDRFPYSDTTSNFNYIRNPVKIVMDAYDGTLEFYLTDPSDPIFHTYTKIFPGFVKSVNEASDELIEHFRYPENLFKIQVDMFSTYHMKDPKVYYNREDLWDTPNEVFGQGKLQPMTPYYVLLKLPEMNTEEYVLMIPYTPVKKDNMIAWISGRTTLESDSVKNELILYKFPKDKLVFGPSQIEARIDQNSEISEQLTLWSQRGSNVIRGNLLVIPIENTLLYIEPLYITADNSEIPELKRIILSYGTQTVMEKDFDTALNKLFGTNDLIIDEDPDETVSSDLDTSKALEYYNKIQESMENKDWVGIGENMDLLEEVLIEISES